MRFLRFLLVGGVSALVQFLVLALCLQLLDFGYLPSSAVAYVTSVAFHFLANRYFTFRLNGTPSLTEVRRYVAIVVLNFIVTMTITTLTVEIFNLTPYIGTIFSIVATVGITFVSGKYWIFKQQGLV